MKMVRKMILRMMNGMLANYETAGTMKKRIISLFMHHFPGQITCEEFGDFMADYLDETLDPVVRRRFDFHMAACPMCRTHIEEYRAAVALAKASAEDAMAEAPQELINAILAARDRDRGRA